MMRRKTIRVKIGALLDSQSHSLCAVLRRTRSRQRYLRLDFSGLRGTGYESFLRELRELGYIEGKNIVIEFRSADNKLDRLPALADELVRLKVDVFFTRWTTDALAAKNATRTIPIVFISGCR